MHLGHPLIERYHLPAVSDHDLLLCAVYWKVFVAEGGEDDKGAAGEEFRVSVGPRSYGGGRVGPDVVDYTIWGSEESARISQWHRFSTTSGAGWVADESTTLNPGDVNNRMQLSNAAAAFAGEESTMPDFAAGLSVQRIIEGILS